MIEKHTEMGRIRRCEPEWRDLSDNLLKATNIPASAMVYAHRQPGGARSLPAMR
jgi:hypothetical protein